MLSVTYKRNGGSVLIFALLGLIALMAIGVVLISRASRDQQVASDEHAPAISSQPETAVATATVETNTDPATTETETAPVEVNFPPPPPPVNTPDTRNLPPEG